MNLQLFGGRGMSSKSGGVGSTSKIQNSFESEYGFANVGTREEFRGIGGVGTVGTVTPTINDVQAYLNTGKFDNYGNNANAKKLMAARIAKDMNGRGFEVTLSEDKTKLLPNGDTSKTITIGRKGDSWVAKASSSTGVKKRGGFKGVLDATSGRK